MLCRDRFAVFARSVTALHRVERFMDVYHIDASSPMDACSHDIASALIEHRAKRSQSPLCTSGAAIQQPAPQPLPAPIYSTAVSSWWESWSTWFGISTEIPK